MRAAHLRTEFLENPQGLGIPAPRFSWHCQGGIRQTAYQITAVRDSGETVWDSGKVESARMSLIPFEGDALRSRDHVVWTVTLWDESGTQGEPASAFFELGLLEPFSDWHAKWISGIVAPKKGRRYPVDCFRKEFAAAPGKTLRRARLYATARGVYDVTFNGTRLSDHVLAPGITDYRKRIQVQTWDLTPQIQAHNTLELWLADGWFRGSTAAYGVVDVYGTQTSLLAQLELTYEDGTVEIIGTDSTWAWSNDGPIRFADLKDGEVWDARRTPSYQGRAKVVQGPKTAVLCASNNVPVREHERLAPALLPAAGAEAVSAAAGADADADADGTHALQQTSRSRILDFGQNIAGYLEFTLQGKPGQILTIRLGEVLSQGHVDLSGVQEQRPAGGWTQTSMLRKLLTGVTAGETIGTPLQEIRFTCSGRMDHYKTSFAVFGFRYAEILGLGDTPLDPSQFRAIAVYSSMEETGRFACSDPRVNRLVENTRWSMKGNFLDIPTDCPTRERLGWTGDAQVFFDTGAYLMDTAAFFRKWLQDLEDNQYPNGLLSAVAPYEGVEMMYKPTGSSVGWADAVYLIPWRHWLRYGDDALLKRCWPMVRRFAEYLLKQQEKDGHYEKGIHLGEWLEPEQFRDKAYGAQTKHPEECTAYFVYAMNTMAQMADLLDPSFAPALRTAAQRAAQAYPRYAQLDTDRQAKLVRPLALGLLEGSQKRAAQKRLLQAVQNFDFRVGTGFLSTPFLLGVLTEAEQAVTSHSHSHPLSLSSPSADSAAADPQKDVPAAASTSGGFAETAYRMLLNEQSPGWLSEVLAGATTIWEDWEGKLSQNHYSPGAVCQWLFDTCAGIRPDGPNHFRIAPVPGGPLEWAEAQYTSPYGLVESRWERTAGGRLAYTITVPSNCTAQVQLPDGTSETISAGVHHYEPYEP